jgi:hypothetical protein
MCAPSTSASVMMMMLWYRRLSMSNSMPRGAGRRVDRGVDGCVWGGWVVRSFRSGWRIDWTHRVMRKARCGW